MRHIINRADGIFTTFYLNPAGQGQLLYEKEVKPSVTEHKHYISAGGLLVGIYLSRSDSTTETRYFHHDRLGSLTLITNASGGQIERLAYEAFGKRRFPAGSADPNNTLFGITTDRGFTSHEHLDEMGLIHMNGRVYDPLVGRFMTPDPFVQSPDNLQSYNRYSYVLNNPLAYTDPSGYFNLGHELSNGWRRACGTARWGASLSPLPLRISRGITLVTFLAQGRLPAVQQGALLEGWLVPAETCGRA